MNRNHRAAMLCAALTCCGCQSDPNIKYREAQLKTGMTVDQIKAQFGDPEIYKVGGNNDGSTVPAPGGPHKHRVEMFRYGSFAAWQEPIGDITKFSLTLTFVDGKLVEWQKMAPDEDDYR
jgi:hypothetical protein